MRFLALAAWILFAFSFLLAARWPTLARWLGGLSRQHRIHHWAGLLTGALALLHTVHEIRKDPEVAFYFEDPFLLLGWVALIFLLLMLGMSFLKKIHHRNWILLHWISVLAFLAALLHSWLFLHQGLWHRLLFAAGLALAFLSVGLILYYRWKSQTWIVDRVVVVGSSLYEILLKPTRRNPITFPAGSLIYARLGTHFSHNWHPFSVASCAMSPEIHLLVNNAGLDTSHLMDLARGQSVQLQGPFSEFEISQKAQLWIAAGAGIAPFLGMARCFDYQKVGNVELIFFEPEPQPALEAELDRLASLHPAFRWKASYGKSADLAIIDSAVGNPEAPSSDKFSTDAERQILVCGSPAFMKLIRKRLIKNGQKASNIYTEEFTPW